MTMAVYDDNATKFAKFYMDDKLSNTLKRLWRCLKHVGCRQSKKIRTGFNTKKINV